MRDLDDVPDHPGPVRDPDASRPGYPEAVGRWLTERLRLGPGRVVADLAAGTGRLTRLLAPSGALVIAVEPVAALRRRLRRTQPDVRVVAGAADSLPLEDHSVDLVVVGQASRWFRAERAMAEIARVLRPNGALAVVMDRPDVEQPIQARLGRIVEARRRGRPAADDRSWQAELDSSPLFELVAEQWVRNEQVVDADGLVERVVAATEVADLPPAERAEVAAEARSAADGHRFPLALRFITESLLYGRA